MILLKSRMFGSEMGDTMLTFPVRETYGDDFHQKESREMNCCRTRSGHARCGSQTQGAEVPRSITQTAEN